MDILGLFKWDALTAVATAALAGIGLITLLYARSQLSEFRKEARIKHLIDLVSEFEREPIAAYRRNLGDNRLVDGKLRTLDLENPPPGLPDLLNFFEHVGYLLDGNYIEFEDVAVEFHYWILHIWADAHELIKAEEHDDSIYYEYFEKMVTRLREYDRPRTGKLEIPSQADIEEFYLEEARLPVGSPIPRRKRRKRQSFPSA